jgi:hypothetical protein
VQRFVLLILVFVLVAPIAFAQRQKAKPKFDRRQSAQEQKDLAQKAKTSREELLTATKKYRDSLEGLVVALKERARLETETLNKKRALIEEGLMAKRDLAPHEQELARIDNQISDTNKRITQADQFRAEVMNLEQLAKNPPKLAAGTYFDNLRYIRYAGVIAWSLQNYGQIESFFQAKFHRPLPISAFGQSDTHNRLGFDHSNSLDVALHPDTTEAQVLMSYLRSQGIPFTAFRGAIPGNATGAHIHIGSPSRRYR